MKNLEQIKNDYAVSKGFRDWYHLSINYTDYDKHWYNVCILSQKECLKLASENLSLEECGFDGRDYGITNENNIIK